MDCRHITALMGQMEDGYLRCKLYADSRDENLCTRHSIHLDCLIDLVLERLRYYVQSYYTLKEMELEKPQNTKLNVLHGLWDESGGTGKE